jgi:hypothetical protein
MPSDTKVIVKNSELEGVLGIGLRKRIEGAGLEPVPRLVLLKAIAAVYRPALGRLERHLGLGSAVGANGVMHFTGFAAVAALSLVSVHYYTCLPLAPVGVRGQSNHVVLVFELSGPEAVEAEGC